MNKLSKLTALLLAIVLALGVPLGAMAEGAEIETKTEYYEVADKILQKMIMAYETYGEYKSMAELIANEDFADFYARLSAEDQIAMENYVIEKFWASCISYTEVGPFMPPIPVGAQNRATTFAVMDRADGSSTEGLHLDKWATPNGDGTYTITLEAYVTGTVKVEQVEVFNPADIVLVLDTSGSMEYDFAGNSTNTNSNTRWYALREALLGGNGTTGFIEQVAAKYDAANGVDHRIAIVDYDTTAKRNVELTYVNGTTNINRIRNAVPNKQGNVNDFQGGTYPNTGLTEAKEILGDDYSYNGNSTKPRSKVVVLFTDGIPSYYRFSGTQAASAINTAKQLKDAGYTVYTVAIISGANPATAVDWSVSRSWDDRNYVTNNSDSEAKIANAFLHAVSSNYKGATATGKGDGMDNNGSYTGSLNVTQGTGANNGYYLTAANKDDLNKIFQGIASNIESGASSVQLTETAVVKDVMSKYFELPKGVTAADITVQTAAHTGTDRNGNPTWANPVKFSAADIEVDIANNTVNVSNFDFADNAVMTVNGKPQGSKLIISFKVKPIEGFLGGNNVVTNDPSSGIYQPNGQGGLDIVGKFPEPNVDVRFKAIRIQAHDQYIYLSNYANLDSLLTSFGIHYTFTDGNQDYEVDGYRNGYAVLRYKLTDPNTGHALYYTIMDGQQTGTWSYVNSGDGDNVTEQAGLEIRPYLTGDHTYQISYEVFAKENVNEDGTIKIDPVTMKAYEHETEGELYPTVYVFKPEVTFQDSRYKYMEQLEAAVADNHYNVENYVHTAENGQTTDDMIRWRNPRFAQDLDHIIGVMPSGPRPTLTFEYDIDLDSWIDGNDKVDTTICVPVNVTKVTATSSHAPDGRDVTAGTTSIRIECDCDVCETTQATRTSGLVATHNPEFVIHVYDVMGSLKITKKAGDNTTFDPNETFIFTVVGKDDNNKNVNMTVTIKGEDSVTINNLLVGKYEVTEDADWSWRYTCTADDNTGFSATAIVPGAGTDEVVFVNTIKNQQWIDGSAYVENIFNAVTTIPETK